MNLVGRILVLLILVMSTVFMGFAIAVYSTHTNWREEIERQQASGSLHLGYKYQLQNAQALNQQLQDQLDKLQQENKRLDEAHKQSIAKLETENGALKDENAAQKAAVEKLEADLRAQTALATTKSEQLKAKEEQVATLRDDVAKAQSQRDEQFRKVIEATDQLNQALTENQRLESTNVRLAQQNAIAKIHLDRVGKSVDDPVDGVPPKVDGIVVAVGKEGLVETSLGSDDGVTRGHNLEVYRGPKYLGRLEVLYTRPDSSVGRLVPGFQQGKIEKEDRVATRLN